MQRGRKGNELRQRREAIRELVNRWLTASEKAIPNDPEFLAADGFYGS